MNLVELAVSLPASLKHSLERLQQGIPQVNWIDPIDLHVTLEVFLDLSDVDFKDIKEALKDLKFPSFSMQLRGMIIENKKKGTGSLWLEVKDKTPLLSLKRIVNDKFATLKDVNLKTNMNNLGRVLLGEYTKSAEKYLIEYDLMFHNFESSIDQATECTLLTPIFSKKSLSWLIKLKVPFQTS
jgi:hypothetical protein